MKAIKNLSFTFKILILITFVGAAFRFYSLDWGGGYFFHPDEHHISIAVNRLSFPDQLNPKLFSYGSFSVYLIFFTKLILSKVGVDLLSLNNIIVGRFYSALFSTATIPLVYLVAKRIMDKKHSLLSAFLVAILPGLIQQAHFTTPESILIFWLLLTLLLLLKWVEKEKARWLILSAISIGLATGTKIVAVSFLPLFLLAFLISFKKPSIKKVAKKTLLFLLAGATAAVSFLTVFPYSLLDKSSFIHSVNYETGVGKGDLLVFYTRQFIDTAPVVFQLKKIFPYALGPFVFLLGGVGAILILGRLLKQLKKKKPDHSLLLIFTAFLVILIPQLTLFAKWTRFVSPSFPFWAIFASFLIQEWQVSEKNMEIKKIFLALAGITTLAWTFMFFSIYANKDVRLKADSWIQSNMPKDSFILTEAGNTYEVPLKNFPKKYTFDFYHLDENPKLQAELPSLVYTSDYFIVQSRRMFFNHQRLPRRFPVTSNFYDQLFSGNLGFIKIEEFNSFPRLTINNRPSIIVNDETAEETWSVFDHPVIRIYEKKQDFPLEYYEEIL